MGNTSTKKAYQSVKSGSAGNTKPQKSVSLGNSGGKYAGQYAEKEAFAEPMNEVSAPIKGLAGTHDDIGELSGFITDGYLDKGSMPFGEMAKFNYLPPGMDISNQVNAEIHEMPMKKVTAMDYGDGWEPAPRDIPE